MNDTMSNFISVKSVRAFRDGTEEERGSSSHVRHFRGSRSPQSHGNIKPMLRMKVTGNLKALSCLLVVQLFCAGSALSSSRRQPTKLPHIVLWAWERPEDLRFIDPQKVAVAFLASSIELSGDRVLVQPRLQPLRIPEGTTLIGVVRITTDIRSIPLLSAGQMRVTAGDILKIIRTADVRGIQIDFDATKSERPFYHELLTALRRKLPDSISLSITALASWCLYDTWIADLPLDDAVPMLFRLGPDRLQILGRLKAGGDFSIPICRHSVGISTDEPVPAIPSNRRIYIFSPHPWSRESFESMMKEIK